MNLGVFPGANSQRSVEGLTEIELARQSGRRVLVGLSFVPRPPVHRQMWNGFSGHRFIGLSNLAAESLVLILGRWSNGSKQPVLTLISAARCDVKGIRVCPVRPIAEPERP